MNAMLAERENGSHWNLIVIILHKLIHLPTCMRKIFDYFIRLTAGVRSDLKWCFTFIRIGTMAPL